MIVQVAPHVLRAFSIQYQDGVSIVSKKIDSVFFMYLSSRVQEDKIAHQKYFGCAGSSNFKFKMPLLSS